MRTETVVAVVSGLWSAYTGDAVRVELLPKSERFPVRCVLTWDGDSWRVFADEQLDAKRLLVSLGHELGHIVNGHIGKRGTLRNAVITRATFTGEVPSPTTDRELTWWDAESKRAQVQREEKEANQFAVEFVRRWESVIDQADQALSNVIASVVRTIAKRG